MDPTGSTMMGYGARESGAGSGVDTWLEEASSIPGVRDIVKPCTAVRLLQEDGSEDAQARTWLFCFGLLEARRVHVHHRAKLCEWVHGLWGSLS
jgi:hypothetical protein